MARRFQAGTSSLYGAGRWYGEYVGRFACRQFEAYADRTMVAPYDVPFVDLDDPAGAPSLEGITGISVPDFEEAWERFAERRMDKLARQHGGELGRSGARYFRAIMPAGITEYGEGMWYVEFADEIARRQMEIYADAALVAPYDIGLADQYEAVVADSHYHEITFAEFEAVWEKYAVQRLQHIAATLRR